MKKIELSNEFFQYQFEAPSHTILGLNIFVLYHDSECIIFDAGYPEHMKQLADILSAYTIKYAIITHFHPDHCYGLESLEKQHVIGSKFALETLSQFEQSENEKLIPSTYVESSYCLEFYNHKIQITVNPGHSNCGTIISIDDKYILVGDDLMATNKGEICLPYVAGTIENHINSLKFIQRNYCNKIGLPSHGNAIENLNAEINKRIAYLNFASTLNSDIEEFYKTVDYRFLNNKWHQSNIG